MLRKILWWAGGIFALLAVLIVLFYAEEDWRGARDWAACQKELAAKGEILDLRKLAPPGKPEDDLSKVPIFAELDSDRRGWKLGLELETANSMFKPELASLAKGKPLDLAAWQVYYRTTPDSKLPYQLTPPAQDVLTVLSQFDSKIDKLDTALSNPSAYWPIDYEKPFDTSLRDIVKMTTLAKFLQLRAVAYLENHQTDLAENDYLFSFCINKPLTKGCFLINYLVMAADRPIDDAILWEGLRRHAWNDAQLHEMESALATSDMLALAVDCLRMERGFGLENINVVQHMNADLTRRIGAIGDDGWLFALETAMIRPCGWWDQDRRSYSLSVIQPQIDAINPARSILNKAIDKESSDSVVTWIYTPLTETVRSAFSGFDCKIAHAETNRRLARLACRLEEYRLAHGQYPDTLEALPDLPAHLNQEVLSEQPLRYQRKGDSYLLYSMGWNQKDEGGLYAADEKEGDWVWPGP